MPRTSTTTARLSPLYGTVCWPTAPDRHDALREPRAAVYTVEVEALLDRETDPTGLDLFAFLNSWWGTSPKQLGAATCEDIAHQIATSLEDAQIKVIRVTVTQDGKVGSTVWCTR